MLTTEKQELIPISINENQEPIVSGRALHEFLEIETPYKKWFDRMVEYEFIENIDYAEVMNKNVQKPQRGRPSTDHALKLDMAKELSMIQRNEKGKQARQYFIQVEKDFNSPEKVMARALKIAKKTIYSLQLETKQKDQIIGELKPKADYTDQILSNRSLVTIN
jgi:anti-repressor protein